jgi:DNA repair protein RecN (Recombination protein N)
MLKTLSVENYALIDRSVIDFFGGFSVITGETGAGKSIILGALNMLLGQRTDSKVIKNQDKKCVVEGVFDISKYGLATFFEDNELDYDDECVIRRELNANGKSRAFVNDTPVTVSVLKDLGVKLIDIHSQHQNLLLNDANFQLGVVDAVAENKQRVLEFRSKFLAYKKELSELEALKAEAAKAEADREFMEFQYSQLKEAGLEECSQQDLEEEQKVLANAENIKNVLSQVLWLLNGDDANVNKTLKDCLSSLTSIQESFAKATSFAERIESCFVDLKDLARELDVIQNDVADDPQRLELVNAKLDVIYTLERKHGVDSVEGLVEKLKYFESQLSVLNSSGEEIERRSALVASLRAELEVEAGRISEIRQGKAEFIESELVSLLKSLGMPNAKLKVDFRKLDNFTATGQDEVSFLFSANKDVQLQPIASIASGGEISRVMLSLKSVLSKLSNLPAIIFDEIDTGVSGDIADRMGDIMKMMGEEMQVVSITHLPQIASKGKAHYKVFKVDTDEATVSNIKRLTDEERVREIAQMVSGSNLTDAAIENAKALLNR